MGKRNRIKNIILVLTLIWTGASIPIVYDLYTSLVYARRAINNLRYNIDMIEEEAKQKLEQASESADKIRQYANNSLSTLNEQVREQHEKLNHLRNLENKRMHELHPQYKRVTFGRNNVGQEYLDFFELKQESIRFSMTNKSREPVVPDFTLFLIDYMGMVTEHVFVSWNLRELEKGETREEGSLLYFRFGDPVYYRIEFH